MLLGNCSALSLMDACFSKSRTCKVFPSRAFLVIPSPQKFCHSLQEPAWLVRLAIPYGANLPSHSSELAEVFFIPLDIGFELWVPVMPIGFRTARIEAFALRMLVPKTTVHEDYFRARREYQVRLSRQLLAVQPVAVTSAMQKPAHDQFRRRILAADTAHVFATCRRPEAIRHFRQRDQAACRQYPSGACHSP